MEVWSILDSVASVQGISSWLVVLFHRYRSSFLLAKALLSSKPGGVAWVLNFWGVAYRQDLPPARVWCPRHMRKRRFGGRSVLHSLVGADRVFYTCGFLQFHTISLMVDP